MIKSIIKLNFEVSFNCLLLLLIFYFVFHFTDIDDFSTGDNIIVTEQESLGVCLDCRPPDAHPG